MSTGGSAAGTGVCGTAKLSNTLRTQRLNAAARSVRANMAMRWQPRVEKIRTISCWFDPTVRLTVGAISSVNSSLCRA